MTRHDFIFSDQRRHRIARHFAFWFAWCLAFNIFFHFPIHVFPGWDFSGPGTKNYQELGPALFFIKTLIVNSFCGVIVPQILVVYVLIFWLLPRYYFKKSSPWAVAVITALVFGIFLLVAMGFKYSPSLYNRIMFGTPINFSYTDNFQFALVDQLSSLPIILGFALTIKLVKRWWLKQKETEQIVSEKTQAELQLLKAQVHPHFLFNTINNIYFFTLTNSTQAPVMIRKLSGLLNYILHECNEPFILLEKEIGMIQDYMALEKIRYSEHVQITIDIKGHYEGKKIAPLLLLPFVENSFKHGVSKTIKHSWVNLFIKIENGRLNFIIKNNKPATGDPVPSRGNIGLKNVKKRLTLLYPANHELNIINEPGCFTASLDLQLYDRIENITITNGLKPQDGYAVA